MIQTKKDQSRSDCPPFSKMEMVVSGMLAEPGLTLCLSHVQSCPDCSALLDGLFGNRAVLPRLRMSNDDSLPVVLSPVVSRGEEVLPLDSPMESGDLGSIGAIRLTDVLGRGPTAITLSGFDTRLHRAVVVKMLRPRLASIPALSEEFFAEGRAAAGLEHPGIVPILWVEAFKGLPFIVMPLLKGESLATRLESGPLSSEATAELLLGVLSALEEAHSRRLVHRDLKPANIWIREDKPSNYRPILLDFGIASHFDSGGRSCGTRGYMSPEQASGEPCDHRSDFFSLGCVTFEMLSGRPAWPQGADPGFLPLLSNDPSIPTKWKPLLAALLQLDPAKRPLTHAAFRALLPLPESSKTWSLLALAAFFALAILCFAAAWFSFWKAVPLPEAPHDSISAHQPAKLEGKKQNNSVILPSFIMKRSHGVVADISGSGGVAVCLNDSNKVRMVSIPDEMILSEIEVKNTVMRMKLNADASMLAVHSRLKDNTFTVTIIDCRNGKTLAEFKADPEEGELWSGTKSDNYIFRSMGGIAVVRANGQGGKWSASLLPLPTLADKSKIPAVNFATMALTDLLGICFSNRSVTVYNVSNAKLVRIFQYVFPEKSQPRVVSWRNSSCCTVVGDRNVVEMDFSVKGNSECDIWQLPSAAMAFCWIGNTEYAMVAETGENVPTVLLGNRGKKEFTAKLDTGAVWIDRLDWIASAGMLAAFGHDGSLRLYSPKSKPVD